MTAPEVMLTNDRSFRVVQGLAAVAVAAGWLYMLAFVFHDWDGRVFFGGVIVDGVTAGLLFERWRQRGDRLARLPTFLAAAVFAVAVIVASASIRVHALAGGIAAGGAAAAWAMRAVRGRAGAGDP